MYSFARTMSGKLTSCGALWIVSGVPSGSVLGGPFAIICHGDVGSRNLSSTTLAKWYAERLVGAARRRWLDQVVVLGGKLFCLLVRTILRKFARTVRRRRVHLPPDTQRTGCVLLAKLGRTSSSICPNSNGFTPHARERPGCHTLPTDPVVSRRFTWPILLSLVRIQGNDANAPRRSAIVSLRASVRMPVRSRNREVSSARTIASG